MIIFTVTNTRKKRGLLLKLGLVLVMVAFLLPYLHGVMLEVSAMEELQATAEQQAPTEQQAAAIVGQDAAGIYEEDFPGEPVRVNGELWLPLAHLQEVAALLSY